MHSEKEIVKLWLNRKGFFTISNIKVGGNREIALLAIKHEKNLIKEIWHIEIVSSIINSDNFQIDDKFNNKNVIKAIKENIKKFISQNNNFNYKKVLVIGKTSNIEKYSKNYKVIKINEILFDLFKEIDTHNYNNNSIRTIQLIKYLLLSDPEYLAKLLDKENKILNLNTREIFLKHLHEQNETKRILSKKSFEPELVKIIKNSSLNKPEKLAKVLNEKILNNKNRKKFIETLIEQKIMKKEIEESMKHKTLDLFS